MNLFGYSKHWSKDKKITKRGFSFGFTYCWLNQFASKVIQPQDLQQDHNQPSSIATIWASFHCLSQRMPYPIFQRQLPSRGVRSSLCMVTIGVQFSSGDIVILTFFGSEGGSGVFWTGCFSTLEYNLSLSLSRGYALMHECEQIRVIWQNVELSTITILVTLDLTTDQNFTFAAKRENVYGCMQKILKRTCSWM